MTKKEIKAQAQRHAERAFKLCEFLLPNSSDYDRAGLADRILRFASECRLLGISPNH
jgi:hypothetical protein